MTMRRTRDAAQPARGDAQPSLLRVCVAATLCALPGLVAVCALARFLSGWSVLAGGGVSAGVSYAYAVLGRGKSSGDVELAIVWTLSSYVAWIVVAVVAFAIAIALGGWLPD